MKINVARPMKDEHSPLFIELAELIEYSARSAGFTVTTTLGDFDLNSKNILISHFFDENILRELPSDSVILNTEQLFSGDTENDLNLIWSDEIVNLAKRFHIWDYSEKNCDIFRSLGINARLFEFGYQPELERIRRSYLKPIDVLFYGSLNQRRLEILDECRRRNLKVKHLYGIYGSERDRFIRKSKVVLNLHYHPSQIFEIVRVHYLVNNNIPVISEINPETKVSDFHRKIVTSGPYHEISGLVEKHVRDSKWRQYMATSAYNLFKDKSQSLITSRMIEETWGLK